MHRSTIDKLISSTAIIIAAVLLVAAAGLFYAHSFVHSQVANQLTPQAIVFPQRDSKSFAALPAEDQVEIGDNAGQHVTTGAQAQLFANHYIAVHLDTIGGGKTYAELSAEAMTDPENTELAAKVDTVFRGETLRGMLLNAYAFDTMATVALYAAIGSTLSGLLLFILALLGFSHAEKVAGVTAGAAKRNASKRKK